MSVGRCNANGGTVQIVGHLKYRQAELFESFQPLLDRLAIMHYECKYNALLRIITMQCNASFDSFNKEIGSLLSSTP